PKVSLTASFEHRPDWDQFHVENKSGGELTNVEVLLTFQREPAQPVRIKASWSSWKEGERKTVSVRPGRYNRVNLAGSADLAGKEVAIKTGWPFNEEGGAASDRRVKITRDELLGEWKWKDDKGRTTIISFDGDGRFRLLDIDYNERHED